MKKNPDAVVLWLTVAALATCSAAMGYWWYMIESMP